MPHRSPFSPLTLPIYFFLGAILLGAVLLKQEFCLAADGISWLDALFTSTSAVCVTGLIVVDTGSHFNTLGQGVILLLIQLGGLGVMTYSSLALYLWRRRVTLTDRISVGQNLLQNPNFHLGRFLLFMVGVTLAIEAAGAALLWVQDPAGFAPFEAVFHSISAFCNAGFSTNADSLMAWQGNLGVNLVFMALITLGGLGFAVLNEGVVAILQRLGLRKGRMSLSFHARVVLRTSLWLVVVGALWIFFMELPYWLQAGGEDLPQSSAGGALAALFQSVTCRTAGFNTLEIGAMTNVSLLFMIVLMLVGGSPGSCAGGIKTTSLRTLLAFMLAHIRARSQAVAGSRALDRDTVNKALTLSISAVGLILLSTLMLSISEGGGMPHSARRGELLEILFEAVSAFGTVGLSTGITGALSDFGKSVIMVLMFTGRLGPILFLSVLQSWHKPRHYKWAEESLMIG